MNVLLVHNFLPHAGGDDQVFADEGALLEAQGHIVARFTMHNDAVQGMGKLELARKTIWNRDAQLLLRDAIRRIDADVVHFHNTFPLISPASYYTAHEQGAAVVQTLHNYRLLCPAATFYRDGHVCEDCLGRAVPWPAVAHRCYRGNRIAISAVTAMLSLHRMKRTWREQVDVYIALTEFSRQKFVQGGLPQERIVVKPNFVDPDPGIGAGDGSFVLFVGRLTDEKGILTLLKAWPPLYKRTGVVLKIAGDGPLRRAAEDACQEGAGIEFLGRCALPQVYAMMGAAQALVFPSQWYEGQPRTIVESLAKGTPVISSRLGSMSELIEDGRTGILFEPGDDEDLSRKTELMLAKGPDRARMRLAARLEFESRYTAARNYPMLIECYELAVRRSLAPKENIGR